eukprot:1278-Prymnesium_polylepis.1
MLLAGARGGGGTTRGRGAEGGCCPQGRSGGVVPAAAGAAQRGGCRRPIAEARSAPGCCQLGAARHHRLPCRQGNRQGGEIAMPTRAREGHADRGER